MNKKVRNTKEITVDDIQFRSTLEGYTYKQLKDNGIINFYEPLSFTIIPGFTFDNSKVRPITYTPDFICPNTIIECKGHPNESFPIRWKLFQKYLSDNNLNYKLYLVHNQKEVNEMIKTIKLCQNF